mmetsp:Transcript_113098/g.365329  ORF Transcript_113098/g.365329 Transcript_113098/m.365329 type:complete len:237 (+) Transcript_113098:1446-2156(+)
MSGPGRALASAEAERCRASAPAPTVHCAAGTAEILVSAQAESGTYALAARAWASWVSARVMGAVVVRSMEPACNIRGCGARPTLSVFPPTNARTGAVANDDGAGAGCSTRAGGGAATLTATASSRSRRRSSPSRPRASASSPRCSRTSSKKAAPDSRHQAAAAARCLSRPRCLRNSPSPSRGASSASMVTLAAPWSALAQLGNSASGRDAYTASKLATRAAGAVSVRRNEPRTIVP